MRVAFLGLGIMGRPMAANLVKAGNEVSVWNRSAGKDVEGARKAVSPADAARDAHRSARILESRHQAKDHPVLLNIPEAAYLKCLLIFVN